MNSFAYLKLMKVTIGTLPKLGYHFLWDRHLHRKIFYVFMSLNNNNISICAYTFIHFKKKKLNPIFVSSMLFSKMI